MKRTPPRENVTHFRSRRRRDFSGTCQALPWMDAAQIIRAVTPHLQQKRKNGWTAEQQLDLLQQRWLADARQVPLVPNIPGRTTDSVSPQLAKIRRLIGDKHYEAGRCMLKTSEAERAKFIADVERLRGGPDESLPNSNEASASACATRAAEQKRAAHATSDAAKKQVAVVRERQADARHERDLRKRELEFESSSESSSPIAMETLERLQKSFPSLRPSVLAAAFRQMKTMCREATCDCCGNAEDLQATTPPGYLCQTCIRTVGREERRARIDARVASRSE